METIKEIVKKHGLAVAVMAAGLWFLNNKLESAENRIAALETRLFDCYEDRIKSGTASAGRRYDASITALFVAPEKKRKKAFKFIPKTSAVC